MEAFDLQNDFIIIKEYIFIELQLIDL